MVLSYMNQPPVHMCPPILDSLPAPSPAYLSGLSQSTSFECAASWVKLALVIYFAYSNIHVSILFSQIIPPSPSPHRVQKSVLLCYLAYRIIVVIFLNSIYMHWYIVFVLLFLTYFTLIICSSFIHLIRTDSDLFLFIAEWYSIVYMYHNFIIHSSASGHLDCLHVLAIVNSEGRAQLIVGISGC